MKKRLVRLTLAAVAALAWHAPARAADDTLLTIEKKTIKGAVKSMSKTEVTIEKAGGEAVTVKVTEIDTLKFAEEKPYVNAARAQINKGEYHKALDQLGKSKDDKVERDAVKQEVQYLHALCNARLALGGEADVPEAGTEMRAFVKAHSDSYHFLPASELLGELLVAAEKYKEAIEVYKVLADSPFEEYKIRAGIVTGRALIAEKKFDEALKAFEAAFELASRAGGAAAEVQRQAATLGKAACLAETGKPDDAIQLIDGVIAKLPAEEEELHARAFVTKGNCYRKKPGNVIPAIMEFLKVDLLYSSIPQCHAEALWNLSTLWPEYGKPERAGQDAQKLKDRYPNSPWAKL
ncbi:MAG TPA: tetratricopeptide repeat protein [Pirellulales bacterium]|jgi:tetratricopeptide (TPR) repeat protein|nr:tetratricopeptide repeat protein [Pirellulales bacterium]